MIGSTLVVMFNNIIKGIQGTIMHVWRRHFDISKRGYFKQSPVNFIICEPEASPVRVILIKSIILKTVIREIETCMAGTAR